MERKATPAGITALVDCDLDSLARHVLDTMVARLNAKLKSDQVLWVSSLLSRLDSLKHHINDMKSLLVTYALAEGATPEQIADWFSATPNEVEHLRASAWLGAQVAAARGEDPEDGNYDAAEGFRSAQAIIRADERFSSDLEDLATVMALSLLCETTIQEHDWLDERAKKSIRQGWSIQPKRVPAARPIEAHQSAEETVPKPADSSAA